MSLTVQESRMMDTRDMLPPPVQTWLEHVMDTAQESWRDNGPADLYDMYLPGDDRAAKVEAALITWAWSIGQA